MSGSIKIPYTSNYADVAHVVIPQTAVCHSTEEGTFVWRVDQQNKVCKVPITIGKLKSDDEIEVISGLESGDRIAVTRLSYLSENEEVTIQQ